MASPMKFIQEQCSINPKQSAHFDELGTLFQARLWSQLSNKLADICRNEFFQTDKHLIRLYENFVKNFEKYLNPLHLAMFALDVSKQYPDAASSVAYLEGILKTTESKISVPKAAPIKDAKDGKDAKAGDKDKGADGKDKPKTTDGKPADGAAAGAGKGDAKADAKADAKTDDKAKAKKDKEKEIADKTQATAQSAPYIQAATLLKTEIVRRKCDLQQLDAAKELLDGCKQQIDQFMGIMDSVIHSHYYLAAFQYFKLKGQAAEYFRHALLYLTYTPLPSISAAAQHTLAADVGMAALLGDDTYNFGELLQHAILKVLEATPQKWIGQLLHAFNAGDIGKFKQIFVEKKDEPMLAKNAEFLNQKVRIMALMEMVLKRGSHTRTFKFEEIAKTCDLPEGHVEFMLMKAFSLKVVRGVVDEVDKTVQIKWVQPRVLNIQQIGALRDRLKDWSKDVHNTANFLTENAPTLIAQQTTA